jgi:hypothetical protein
MPRTFNAWVREFPRHGRLFAKEEVVCMWDGLYEYYSAVEELIERYE